MRIYLQKWIYAAGLLLLCAGKLSAQHFSFTCARDTVIPACLPSGCFTLKHILPDLRGLSDSYTINPSNYSQSSCVPTYVQPNDPAGTPTNLTIDDRYSGLINIGFSFPFYGTLYNSLVASTNGYVSFDATLANTGSHWAAGADLPSGTYDRALIMGPYHDLDPSVNTSPTRRIQYQVWGVAPHRRWVLSFYRVPLFGGACNPIIENTHQIILYESTGIIEVTILSKQACNGWNSGRALVGIQNFARTLGMTVPGRAAIANPPWNVSAPGESWRFVPNSGPSLFKRVELLDAGGTLLTTGTTAPLSNGRLDASFPNVCPPAGTTTTYIVRSVYQKIDDPATEIFGYDTVRVNRSSGLSANASFSSGSCGAATGTITVNNVVGGDGNYQYSLNGGPYQAGNVFNSLAAGNYTVTVRDGSATPCTITLNVTVPQTGFLTATITAEPTTCTTFNNGSISINTPGGGSGFNVSITNGGGTYNNVSMPFTTPTTLPVGSYQVTVSHPATNCNLQAPVTVQVTQGPGVTGDVTAYTPASCFFAQNGSATIRPTAGTGPFTLTLSPVGTVVPNVTNPHTFTNLPGGPGYSVVIQDATGCNSAPIPLTIPSGAISATATPSSGCGPTSGVITISNPGGGNAPYEFALAIGGPWQTSNTFTGLTPGNNYTVYVRDASQVCITSYPLTIPAATGAIAINTSSTPASCAAAFNGTITVTVPGGGTYGFSIDGQPPVFQASPYTFTALGSGGHTIVVTAPAPSTCTSGPVSVSVGIAGSFSATTTVTATTCPGINDGVVTVIPDPGGSPYLYVLDGTINATSGGASYPFTGLSAGPHTIVVTNVFGCVTATINVNVPAGPPLSITPSATATLCSGATNGSITIPLPAGGSGNYIITLDGGSPVTSTLPYTFNNVSAGNHTVVVVNAAGCNSGPVSVNVAAGPALTASIVPAGTTCGAANGSISISAPSGGTAPYEYSLDGITWQSGATFTNLPSGTYTVRIRDNGGICTLSTANIVVTASTVITAGTQVTNASCGSNNGSITVNPPAGGTAPYQYSIDGGSTWQASPVFPGLGAGNYNVTIRDAAATACTTTLNNIAVSQIGGLVAAGTSTALATCGNNNGILTVNIPSGGTAPYQYSINGGTSWQAGNVFTGLAQGTYTVTIRDAGAPVCTISINNVVVAQTTAVSASGTSNTQATCGGSNGSITVNPPSGGTAPYQYSINGGTTWQASPTFTGLAAGTYTITIRDNGATVCTTTINNVAVTQSSAISPAGATPVQATCGGSNGSITVNAPSGGTPPYQYSLDGGTTWQVSNTFNGLTAGSYTVTIRDAGATACTAAINNVVVSQTTAVTATGAIPALATCGASNGSITVNAPGGGTPPYQYSIDGGTNWQPSNIFTGLAPGNYTVTIRDAGATACTATINAITVGQTTAVVAAGTTSTQATCGNANGSITVNPPTGGTPPYQYSINGGTSWQPGTTFTGLAAGSYTITIRDAGAIPCTATINTINVGQTTAVIAAGATTAIATCGSSNGSITVNVPSGGTPPYQYSINGGTTWQAGTTFTGLAPGSYTVTIRDAGATACTTTITGISVGQTTAITAAGASTTSATCGLTNGSIAVNAPGGGTPPYQYSIDGGTNWQASPSFFGLAPGSYTVTIRDAAATPCTGTVNNITVSGTTAITASGTTSTQATCGNPNGSITVNPPTGGTPPYQYSINGGASWQATTTFSGLAAGSYTITIRDAGATPCTSTISNVTVGQTSAVSAVPQSTAASCGNANGSINVTGATGGTPPYEYSLDGVNWQTGATFNGLTIGNYTVWVRDQGASCSSTLPVTVGGTTAVIAAGATAAIATCGANNGSITVNAPSGGTPPYQYSIDGGTSWQATSVFNGLAPGSYTITIRDAGATLCTATINNISVGGTTAITATGTITTQASCGNNNGSITVNAPSGGTPPYQYSMDGGSTWQASPLFNGLAGGIYTITIRDAGATVCSTTITNVNVAGTTAVTAAGATSSMASCGNPNGTITVNAPSGGTPPYQYSIDGGTNWQASNVFTGLASGSYTVTIRDAGATFCTAQVANITVGQTTAVAAAGATPSIATCGANNGSITVNAPTGGTPPYQYSIDGGASWQASNVFNGLAPNTYSITIRDAGATTCTATINSITVNQTTAVTAAGATTTQATCGNPTGGITVNPPSGGTAPYQYSIDGGTTWQASNIFSGLASGVYTVTIRDAGATVCTTTINNINVGQTSAVSAAPVATGATCGNANGSINVAGATGGTPPYQYSLDGVNWQASTIFTGLSGGNYTVWVRDLGATCSTTIPVNLTQTAAVTATTSSTPTACGVTTGTITVNGTAGGTAPYQYSLDGVSWQASNLFNNLGVGNYTVRVRDNGAVCSTTLPVTITQTGSIAATTTSVQASCSGVNNGSITINSAGGSGPYTFSLDGGAPQAGTIPYTFNNVSAGAHTVVVADQGSGCSTNVLNVNVGAGAGVSGSATQTATSCPTAANGSVTVTAITGAAPYTFAIDGGAAQAGPSPFTFNNLSTGPHTVLITDNNGCTSTVNVTVAAGPSLAASGITTATACSGINNGTITVTPSNGTGPFQYSLDGGAPVAGGSPYTFTGVAAGPHVVVVTDAAGCVSNLVNVTVTTGAGVSGTATSAATSCPSASNGTITITATLGTAPYTYALDGGVFQSGANPYTFTAVAAGPHTVVIRDNAGCTQTINTTVTAGPALSTTVTKTDALCNGGATGSITVTQPGSGVPPFQYSLDGITWQASNLFNGLTAATYTVHYRESGGCQGSQTVTITEPAALAATGNVTAARCNGQSNGTITVTAAGGTGPYQYSIDGGTTWQAGNLFTVAAGNHTITIRDANNCSTTRNFTVTEPAVLMAGTVTTQASCNGGNDGVITVTAAGGNAGYQYSIDGTIFQASNVFNVGPGAYTVTVRDNQGCITTATATITVGSNFVLVPQPDVTICEGRSAQLQVNSNATQFSWSPATSLSSTTIANPVASPTVTTQYIVTATFGRCSGADTIVVRVNPAPIPNAGPDGIVCYGQPYQLQGSGGVQYQWTPSNYLSSATIANPVASPPRQTTYSLSILADANGCASLVSDQVTLDVNPPITVKTTPYDTIAYTGDQFPMLAIASDPTATNYTWTPAGGLSSATVNNPDVTITAATGTILRYQVSATNAAGCRGDGFVTIRVYKGPDVYVPSGFTPNGDGRNDRLIPIPVGIERMSYFRVVNRWGQLVYSTSKLQEGWDGRLNGTEQPSAVYVWMFEGFTRDGRRVRKEGTVALIR